MKTLRFVLVITCIVTVAGFNSCKKDDFDFKKVTSHMDWNPSYVIPVAYGSLDMRDIIRDYDNENLFHSEGDGLLKMVYYASIGQYHSDDKFYMPTQSVNESMTSTEMTSAMAAFTYAGATMSYNKTQDLDITIVPGSSEIDSVKIKSGTLKIGISSTFMHPGSVTLTFPDITKNGIAYSQTVDISGSGNFIINTSFNDLNGYKMDLTHHTPSYNKMKAKFDLTMTHSGNSNTSGTITFDISLDFIKYSSMYGYFGNQQIMFARDSIDLTMFSDAFTGGYFFEDPKFNVRLKNSFGVPLQFMFTNLRSYSTIGGDSMHVTGTGVPTLVPYNPKVLNSPLTTFHYGETLADNILLDKSNSNLVEVMGNTPHYFVFNALAETNPNSALPHPHNNYITDNSTITADLEVELPLWGRAKGLALGDTEKFEFTPYYQDYHGNVLRRVIFRIASENHLPMEIGIQLYFVHHDTVTNIYTIKDSLMANNIIVPSGTIDANGKVISSGTKVKEIMIEQSKLKTLKDAKITDLIYRAYFNTSNGGDQSVRFYQDDKINIHTGLRLDFGTNTFTIQNY